MKKMVMMAVVFLMVAMTFAEQSPCNPTPVKQPVVVVRRELKVSIIGADRSSGRIVRRDRKT